MTSFLSENLQHFPSVVIILAYIYMYDYAWFVIAHSQLCVRRVLVTIFSTCYFTPGLSTDQPMICQQL